MNEQHLNQVINNLGMKVANLSIELADAQAKNEALITENNELRTEIENMGEITNED